MSFNVTKSTQFKVNEIVLVTKAGPIEISSIFEEINIFDSLFLPVMSGNILINDSVGLSGKLLFDGSESILIDVSKDVNSEIGHFKKAFRIYKQSARTNSNLTNESYVLHFVSDELMYSDQQRINQSFESTYSEIVKNILINYLKVPLNNLGGIYDSTSGIRQIVIPNLRPLEAIEWCAKRSVDFSQSPNFMFYQNLFGYNFASLSTLLTQPEILDINFPLKNQEGNNPISEMGGARNFEVLTQSDNIEKTRSGVNAGKFTGFDLLTGTIANKNVTFDDHYNKMKHGNDNPNISILKNRDGLTNINAFNSKQTLSVFGAAKKLSAYIKTNDAASLSKENNTEDYILQRKSIISNLTSKRIKVVMPGNFQLTSVLNVNIKAPNFAKKFKGEDSDDPSLSGKYLIIASRQIIGFDKHETIMEVASTSTNNDFIPVSSEEQTRDILEY